MAGSWRLLFEIPHITKPHILSTFAQNSSFTLILLYLIPTSSQYTTSIHSFIHSFTHSFINSFMFSLIHSFHSLSYDKSTDCTKASPPQCSILCFLFQFPVPSRLLKVIQYLLTSILSPSCHFYLTSVFLSIMSFRTLFLLKMWPIQFAFLFFTLHLPHDRSIWSDTTFQKFPGVSDLISEGSSVQHRTHLYSRRSSLQVSSHLTLRAQNLLFYI